MTHAETTQQLDESLDQLEAAVGTPVVPGELQEWTGQARAAFDRACEQLDAAAENRADTYQRITEEDPGLFARVDQLKAKAESNQETRQKVQDRLQQLEQLAARAGADEKAVVDEVESFVDVTQKFVVAVRQHENAVNTWLQEAFNRDRGVAD